MERSRRSAAAKSARPSCPMAPPTVRCVDTCGSGQPPAALALRVEQPLRLRGMLAVALAGRAMLGAGSDMTEPWSMTDDILYYNVRTTSTLSLSRASRLTIPAGAACSGGGLLRVHVRVGGGLARNLPVLADVEPAAAED